MTLCQTPHCTGTVESGDWCIGCAEPAKGPKLRDARATVLAGADDARFLLLSLIQSDVAWAAIVQHAVDRATSVGAAEYGDASYSKSPGVLLDETFAEL